MLKRANTAISESTKRSIEDLSSLDMSKTINVPSSQTNIPMDSSNLRIEIVANISPDTIIYHDNYFNTNNVLNNYSKLLQTIVLDAIIIKRRTTSQKVQIDEFLLQLLQYELKVPPSPLQPFISKPLFWEDWLCEHLDKETFYFFCFDDIQVLTEFEMEELKWFFKSGFCPSNMLAIVTGSSHSVLLKRSHTMLFDELSLQESVSKYTIPSKGLSLNDIQDTITALKSNIPNGYLTLNIINDLLIVFREIHPVHLSMMHQECQHVESFVEYYQQIYLRDFPFLTNTELTVNEEKVIKYLLQGDFSDCKDFENTDLLARQFILRDLVFDKMLHCHFMIDSTFGKILRREPSDSTDRYFFFLLLPLLEYGETLSQGKNCLHCFTRPNFTPSPLNIKLLQEDLDQMEENYPVENSFDSVVIGARNIVFHSGTNSPLGFELFLKHWFNNSKLLFQTFLIDLIEVNSINNLVKKYKRFVMQ